ncbi:YoaH family protein [Photobacterium sp. MCCC 1A19761]|uniref:YoaH family protein n=1 Tax=Photobacterium sp. MCCC 1A19761 TaxID=3115000 RepID=UPI00307DBCF2
MLNNTPTLTHEQQQQAADRIHELMAQGMSSGQAIMMVANEIREADAKNKAQDGDTDAE